MITGTDSPERVTFLRASLNDRLSKAGMLLTKWCSSSSAVMDTIPEFFKESEPLQIILKLTKPYESIGIPVKMCYIFLSQYCRFLSSRPNVMWSLPLPGWFAPANFQAKNHPAASLVGLDDPLPQDISTPWNDWCLQLPHLQLLGLKCCIFKPGKDIHIIQLHGYSNASMVMWSMQE